MGRQIRGCRWQPGQIWQLCGTVAAGRSRPPPSGRARLPLVDPLPYGDIPAKLSPSDVARAFPHPALCRGLHFAEASEDM